MKKIVTCENCDECIYAGTGDFVCMLDIPVYVKENWKSTENYLRCRGMEEF